MGAPRLPKKDNPRRAMWLENSRRRDPSGQGRWDPASKYIYFCSKHFEKSCFEIVGFSGYHRLKEGAVPTVFESATPKPPRAAKPKPPAPPSDPPKPLRASRRWRRDPAPPPPEPPFAAADASCFPRDGDDPAVPAGHRGGVPALPGPSGALPDGTAAATGDGEAATAPALPEGPGPDPDPAPARPASPSLYMLRLPPPAGAYIQSEHSYQVGSALLWKRRAEAALDALDKAQRQLQACKRREQRLRLRVGELQRERRAPAEPRRPPKGPPRGLPLQLLRDGQ
ncbi:THAP domain-containing protein 7 isoform X2 [Dromaius novaehollandiae]|uniref:THAP domain-containing protein 7 isoform X2 n=1 Tax=Dromaius novaehollandiae TaxID=8790 RepID=UPI00311F8CC4